MNPLHSSSARREPADETAWLAFRYIAGDMPDAERVGFESRLAEELAAGDLTLSEAVAQAVELAQATQAAAERLPAPMIVLAQPAANWNTRLSWLAAGMLAGAAVLALGLPSLRHLLDSSTLVARGVSPDLAVAWSESQPLWSSDATDAALAPATDNEAADEDAVESDLPAEVPSWMLAAVRGLAEKDGVRSGEMYPAAELEN